MEITNPKQDLIKNLAQEIKRGCEPIPNMINSGGCGLFAYYASVYLTRIGIPHKIVACYSMWNDCKDWEERIKGFHDHIVNNKNRPETWYALSCSHVMIQIGNWYLDCDGLWTKDLNGKVKDSFTPKGEYDLATLKWSLRTSSGWNSMFDRDCVPMIRQAIRQAVLSLNNV
jgi:hypothetical protein